MSSCEASAPCCVCVTALVTGLPTLGKYDSNSTVAATASSTFFGLRCFTSDAICEFSIWARNWFRASLSRAFYSRSLYALLASVRRASPKDAQSSPVCLLLALSPAMYSSFFAVGVKARRCKVSTHLLKSPRTSSGSLRKTACLRSPC